MGLPITQLLSAAASEIGLSAGHLRFVSDVLEAVSGPALLFFTNFLPDPVLRRLSDDSLSYSLREVEDVINDADEQTTAALLVCSRLVDVTLTGLLALKSFGSSP
ncbi:hypothetical protein AB1Y20_017440 [Prymnesium parvum]|uniref:Uncharacterized protein n=1 Tax=Prymnesium parvum TaxID=97485 RepID=A0AB34JN86_PRYPA